MRAISLRCRPGVRLRRLALGALAATLLVSTSAIAQSWPVRPIRYIVAFPPGGTTDLVGRLVAQRLQEAWGQPVVVENRPGAAGTIGSEFVAKAPADGYTLLGASVSSHAINASLMKSMPYDPVRDFAAVALTVTQPNVLLVHPSVPARNVAELLALLRTKPGELGFATTGNGTSQHLAGELLMLGTGVRMVHVPYKGSGPAMNDLVAGVIPIAFENIAPALPLVKAGRVRALAVTTTRRSGVAPDVPTMEEAGVPNFDISSWQAVFAPAGTPPEIVQKLSAEIVRALGHPEVRERLVALGADPVAMPADQFGPYLRREVAKWAALVKQSGARVE
jgi:tripartite-type tricarboxylate transporter receptor subunit TctC